MGNSSNLKFIQKNFPPNIHKWKPYQASHNNHNHSYKLVIEQSTNLIAQKYTIKQFQSLQYELQTFLYRKTHSSTLVTIYDIQLPQTTSVIIPDCMINQYNKSFTAIIQRIPYRLVDLGTIKFQEMIYILQQSFKALNVLYKFTNKYYLIDQDTICFNAYGQCKIWINQNLSKNIPNINASFVPQTIIAQLFQNLQSRLSLSLPQIYYQIKNSFHLSQFSQALSFINKIKKKLKIQISYIQSLKQQTKINNDSDSNKAINQQQIKKNRSQQKRNDKYSLKNSRNFNKSKNRSNNPPSIYYSNNYIPNKLSNDLSNKNTSNQLNKQSKLVNRQFKKTVKTNISKQQTNDQTEQLNIKIGQKDIQIQKMQTNSFKSVKNNERKQIDLQWTSYSQKTKPKISSPKIYNEYKYNDRGRYNNKEEAYSLNSANNSRIKRILFN